MTTLIERCRKPGCGADRRIGNPCTDWDCPQNWVSASDYRAALTRAESEIAEAVKVERDACAAILSAARAQFSASDLRNDDQTRRWYPFIDRQFAEAERAIRARVTSRALEALTGGE